MNSSVEAIKRKYADYLRDPYNIPDEIGNQIKAEVLALLGLGMVHDPVDPRLIQQKLGVTIDIPMREDIVADGTCAHAIWSVILPHLVQGGCASSCTKKSGCKKWWCMCMMGWDGSGPLGSIAPGMAGPENPMLQEGVISRLQKLANIKKK